MKNSTTLSADQFRLVVLYSVVLLIFVLGSMFSPYFRSSENLSNIFAQAVPLGMVALGQTLALLTAGVDLSVGGVMSLATALAAVIIGSSGISLVAGLAAVLLMSAMFGFVNGWARTKLRLPPFIATLCTMMIAQGLALAVLPQPGGYIPTETVGFLNFESGAFRIQVVYLLLAIVIIYVFLHHRPLGRHFYAVGGSPEAARASGLRVTAIIISSQVACSVLAGIGGLMLATRIQSGGPNMGNPFLLDSIVATLIGGTTFAGGKGGILGTIAGVLILAAISNAINMYSINPFFSYIIKGTLFVAAILAYSYQRR